MLLVWLTLAGFVAIEVQRHHLELNFMGTAVRNNPLYSAVIDDVKGLDSMNSAFDRHSTTI